MLIHGTSITVTYNKVEGLKRAYYENENILKDYFDEATTLPIPDEAPLEIPRIIIKTSHEHAQLNISPIAATFEVQYDSGFEENWNFCSKYIKERMDVVFQLLDLLTNKCYKYIGMVSNVFYNEVTQGATEKIAQVLLNAKKINNIYDINIKYTFVEDGNIFVNIMLQNARIFNNGAYIDSAGSFCESEQVSESIGVVVDINDRYGFNNNKDYKSDSQKLQKLISSMTNIIDNKLSNLIEKGEY